ncbi:uncharacterized protein CPUR_08486 [Claviceps purpurea 20.1]|uniref:Low temperature requirement A n=1 Tax=Claviceps purpurea (strain 20.1) TaxID=1111077 RepID=M1WGI4_CLAP2|nr:uncharacterized protein CPUR_08486 [Claviceps purpurea 20.1]
MEAHELRHHHHHHRHGARDRLNLFKSPVAGHLNDGSDETHDGKHQVDSGNDEQRIPILKRYEEPTLLEIFYDLFFAANYTVFSENREVTNHDNFKAYIGYFCLLWITWFLTASYDVRFVTDSIFERTARAVSLGVLVGFAIVAPNFDPGKQEAKVMRTMSLILMFSRAILVVEYATTLWHVRRYEKSRIPLYVSIAVNAIAMFIYLGVTFSFQQDKNSRVYITWYCISGAEGIATLIISYVWPVMDFSGTHFIKRLTLLTVMMLGDGLINIAKEVVTIVQAPDAWDSRTIGLITAGVATIYFVFLIYFDWLRSSFYLPPLRQIIWTGLHLPFHLSLVLFLQAFTKYILWGKVMGILKRMNADISPFDGDSAGAEITNMTSADMVKDVQRAVDDYFSQYPAKSTLITSTVNVAIRNISLVPDSLWPQIIAADKTGNASAISSENMDNFSTVAYSFQNIILSLTNNLFQVFGIDVAKDVIGSGKGPNEGDINSGILQTKVDHKTWRRYRLVFAYGYIAAGCCLLLMVALSIVTRMTRWKPWPVIRLVILVLLAIGTGLVSLLWFSGPTAEEAQNDSDVVDRCLQYLGTPWVLLTIFVVYTIVLILTHIGDVVAKDPTRPSDTLGSREKKTSYNSVSMPLTSSIDCREDESSNIHGLANYH